MPVGDLVAMSASRFQDDQDVYSHYAEAMALVVFLMHAEGGTYRDGFLGYVADAYRGRFRPGASARSLCDRLGLTTERVDERFREFLTEKPTASPIAAENALPGRIGTGGNLRSPGPR